MNFNDKRNSSLPDSLDELIKKLQEENTEDFATKLVSDYMERLHSK